jgi:hypothetical protein
MVEEYSVQETSVKQPPRTANDSYLLCLFFYPEIGGDMFLRNVDFNGLNSAMSQNNESFIITVIRTLNRTPTL